MSYSGSCKVDDEVIMLQPRLALSKSHSLYLRKGNMGLLVLEFLDTWFLLAPGGDMGSGRAGALSTVALTPPPES